MGRKLFMILNIPVFLLTSLAFAASSFTLKADAAYKNDRINFYAKTEKGLFVLGYLKPGESFQTLSYDKDTEKLLRKSYPIRVIIESKSNLAIYCSAQDVVFIDNGNTLINFDASPSRWVSECSS